MNACDPLDLARELLAHGVPVVVCRPRTGWKPGDPGSDLAPPTGWAVITAAECDLSSYRPGVDTLAMVGGHGVDVVDVDTKDDGSLDSLPAFTAFGRTLTPSGGLHLPVRSTGIGKLNPLATSLGHVGDYVGGTIDGGSRMLAYLPGSCRPKYPGATYVMAEPWDVAALMEAEPDDDLIAALLAAGGSREGRPGKPAATYRDVAAFVAEHAEVPTQECRYGRAAIAGLLDDARSTTPGDPKRGRHGWAVKSAVRAVELVRAGCASSADLDRLEAELHRIKPEGGTDWWAVLAWAMANGDGATSCGIHGATTSQVLPEVTPVPEAPEGTRAAVADLLDGLREWQHLPDATHVIATLAAAATRHHDGEPCWLLLVAPPSSGKTETVRILDDAAGATLDEVTAAGLLGWSKGKAVRPTGVLARVGAEALVTFGDLSSLLATSDRGGRDQVFGLLRRAYDGHVTRDVSPPGKPAEDAPAVLSWSGRLTVVGCVTGAIDRFSAHADSLGARWVYIRLPERTTEAKRHAAALARRGGLAEHRRRAREAADAVLAGLPAELPPLPDAVAEVVEDAALVTAWGRGTVPRNGYGRRDIEGMPVVEEPMRLVQQLGALARGVLALGLPAEAAAAVARRVGLDSMPEARRAVLAALATGGLLSTSAVARYAQLDRKVARFQLEELQAIGVVTNDRVDDEAEEIVGAVTWHLDGDDGDLIADVFRDHGRSGGWDEMWVYTSTTPQVEGETEPPAKSKPTFRPTPAEDDHPAVAARGEAHASPDPEPWSRYLSPESVTDVTDVTATSGYVRAVVTHGTGAIGKQPPPPPTPTNGTGSAPEHLIPDLSVTSVTPLRAAADTCSTCHRDPGKAGLINGRCWRCEVKETNQ